MGFDFEGRGRAIQTVLDYAEASKMRRQVRSAIGQVCEELLMNALYDAPRNADGSSRSMKWVGRRSMSVRQRSCSASTARGVAPNEP